MRAFFSYLYPATVLHFGFVLLYDLIWLAGFAGPINSWWLSLEGQQEVVYVATYLGFVLLIAVLGVTQRWHQSLRWILEIGARRGLRMGGLPIFDFAILGLFAGLLLVVANLAPAAFSLLLYLIGPLLFASVFSLLFRLPPDLHVIADQRRSLADLARNAGCDPAALARENGLDEQLVQEWVNFAGELRLPLDAPAQTHTTSASGPSSPITP